jgi:hypothetical protein
MPLVAGAVLGLTATWWTGVHASSALPNLSLTTVASGQVVSGVVSLAARADAAGLSSLQFQVSGQNVGSNITAGACVTSWDTRNMADGSHTVAAVATDSVGNSVWASPIVVTVQNTSSGDLIAPTVALGSPTSGSTVAGSFTLTASASDNTGVAGVWFTVDGTTVGAEDAAAPYQLSWNSASVANGTHIVRALARDAAGNVGTSGSVTVTVNNGSVDSTLPTVSITAPGSGATVGGTITVTTTSADNVGVASVRFTLDGAVLGTDTSAPFSWTWNTTTASNGTHGLKAFARDTSGNEDDSPLVTVTVDNTTTDSVLPVVSMTTPSAGASVSGTVTVSATASDNVGVSSVQFLLDGASLGSADSASPYSISWTTTGVSNGSHVLSAVARDAAGNAATSSGITVTVSNQTGDTTAPSVSLSSPASGATVSGSVTVSASASDNVGVTSVQFTLDGVNLGAADTSSPYSVSWPTTSATNGTHVLRAVARDAAGNVTTSGSRTVTVSNSADRTLPSVSLSAPSSGATVSGTVTVSASASDNVGVTSVQFTLDGVDLGSADTSAPWSISWNTTAVANGSRVLRAIARDAAGNARTSSGRTVTVNNSTPDTTAPNVALTAPASGATVGGVVTVAATASDNVAVVGVQFMLNGQSIGSEVTMAPYAATWPTTGVPDGPYQITAVARDAAGNRRTSAAITVAVANQAGNGVVGDFNNDGTPDLLFAHTSGTLYAWFMDAARMIGGDYVSPQTVPAGWQVVGIDDFNADGKSDIIIQNQTTGQLTLWAMDGLTRIDEVSLLATNTPWRVGATGDFNGDGQADIIWQHPSTGQLYVWLMDGPNMIDEGYPSPAQVDLRWKVVGTADMNGDGKVDLVWQSPSTGELVAWMMDGLAATTITRLNPAATNANWRIRAVADFDRDGQADLVWQHVSSGSLYIWYMNGTRMVRDGYLSPKQVSGSWTIVGGK